MRIAVISVHGCPLLVPGTREAGGMNVYVAQMSQELARLGIAVDVFTRWHDYSPTRSTWRCTTIARTRTR